MHIMTKTGWKMLEPRVIERTPFAPELYRGPIPSFDCLSCVKNSEREHKEWVNRRQSLVGE